MSESDSAERVFNFFFGCIPLSKAIDPEQMDKLPDVFEGLLPKLKQHLESFANVAILEVGASDEHMSVRHPRSWSPVAGDESLPLGNWAFSESFCPIIFRIHLPTKIQNKNFPVGEDASNPEDFVVAYDGMVFVAGTECKEHVLSFWTPPMLREYLTQELFKGFQNLTPIGIPPNPMHVGLEVLISERRNGETRTQPSIKYLERTRTIVWELKQVKPPKLEGVIKEVHRDIYIPIHRFYHLQIDKMVVDQLYREILESSEDILDIFSGLLATAWWNFVHRAQAKRELSVALTDMQRSFCEHSLAFANLQEERAKFAKDVRERPPLGAALDYFHEMTQPDQLNYDVFYATLEHVRSHLLVLAQNRYLIYAAVVGSLLTLLATYLPQIIHDLAKH